MNRTLIQSAAAAAMLIAATAAQGQIPATAPYYTDPQNSLIDQVLGRRQGIPISLSIVYLLVASRVGLELEPVGLPGHFLVGCYRDRPPFFIDPFEQGAFRTRDEIYALLRARQIVPRASGLTRRPERPSVM